MPSVVVTRTYSSAARSARSLDSSTLMPPNSTNLPALLTSMVGWILTVVMGSPRGLGPDWSAAIFRQPRSGRPAGVGERVAVGAAVGQAAAVRHDEQPVAAEPGEALLHVVE